MPRDPPSGVAPASLRFERYRAVAGRTIRCYAKNADIRIVPVMGQLSTVCPMPLASIPNDPSPSESDLAAFSSVTRELAEMAWRDKVRTENPDAFLVPFVPNVENYLVYLRSPLWRKIRRRVLNAAHRECAGCGQIATEVHHRDYRPRVLKGKDDGPLARLIRGPVRGGVAERWAR